MSLPAWLMPAAYVVLNPPPDIMALGDHRSAENLLKASLAIHVREAPRYQPHVDPKTGHETTYCNIAAADICQILKAPLPHVVEGREQTANMISDDLAAGKYPGWASVPTPLDASNRAQLGLPTLVLWKNSNGTGHIAVVVPAPAGHHGVYITQAGGQNLEQLPLVCGFGAHDIHCQFWGHN